MHALMEGCDAVLQFGYTRKDIILLGVGIIAFGYALYYGLQARACMLASFTESPCSAVQGTVFTQAPACTVLLLSMCAPWPHGYKLLQCSGLLSRIHSLMTWQAAGVDALVAGNYVQLFVFLGIGVGYISTYISRVANKVHFSGLLCFVLVAIMASAACKAYACRYTPGSVNTSVAGSDLLTPRCVKMWRYALPHVRNMPVKCMHVLRTGDDVREAAGGLRGGSHEEAAG